MSKGDSISSFVGDIKLIVNQLCALGNIAFDESIYSYGQNLDKPTRLL